MVSRLNLANFSKIINMPLYLILIFVFAGIGAVDTIYLSYHAITKTPVACWFFPKEWCLKVQQSPQSRLFGFPNAYAGLAMYVAVILFGWLFAAGLAPFWPVAAVVAIGFLFSLYFTYVQAFVLKAFCTWCVVSAINFLALFASAYLLR